YFMFTCGVCGQSFGRLTSLKNHKKIHKNNYHFESETDTSTDTYSSDNNDLISDNQEIDNDSGLAFNIQSTSGKSNLILDNQEIDIDESSSTFDTQSTSSESDLVLNNQEITNEIDSIFDQEISNRSLTYEFGKIFEGKILDGNDMFVDEIDESQNDNSECSDSEVDNRDFPSNAYRDFMNIVIRYKLSYKAGDAVLKFIKNYSQVSKKTLPRSTKDGLLFLDTLREDRTRFFSTSVAQIKDQIYSFEYRPILSAVKEILQHEEIAENCIFDYQEVYVSFEASTVKFLDIVIDSIIMYYNNIKIFLFLHLHVHLPDFNCDFMEDPTSRRQEKVFSEFYNCEWWSRAQQHIPFENKVLAIILYSDATTLDRLGKSSRHPIYISLGNIPTTLRNRTEAKALVGIIPILKGTKEERQTPQFRQLIRSIFHKCINILIEPLQSQYQSGILLKVNKYNIRCNMMLACVIGDWPENCKSCLTYSGTSCARPCHTCLVGKDELNAIKLSANRKITRTEDRMRQIIAMGQGKEHSLHEEINSFWNHL
ncbi:23189_t:CDS:2, partial [Gigaspora rosea]